MYQRLLAEEQDTCILWNSDYMSHTQIYRLDCRSGWCWDDVGCWWCASEIQIPPKTHRLLSFWPRYPILATTALLSICGEKETKIRHQPWDSKKAIGDKIILNTNPRWEAGRDDTLLHNPLFFTRTECIDLQIESKIAEMERKAVSAAQDEEVQM